MTRIGENLVKLVLRGKEYEVKPGMNLLAALQKCNIIPESVIATREGEMILDDEILKDGDVVRLVAVISGGAGIENRYSRLVNHGRQGHPAYRISNNERFDEMS
jgi:sulfur carrier protein ThiS